MQWLRMTALCGVFAMASACAATGPKPADGSIPPSTIELSDLDPRRELQLIGGEPRRRFLSDPAELQKLIEGLYFRRRMTELADSFGAAGDADLQALMRRDREYRLGDWVPRRFLENLEVPDLTEQARAHYEANLATYTPKEALHLQGIFLQATDTASRRTRKGEAEALLARLRAGADFGDLAEKHSEDDARFLKGDLGNNIMRGKLFPEVEPAAFALAEVGELSDVVESPYGFHIFKLLGRREAVPLPFEQVKEPILDQLQTEYRKRAMAEWTDRVAPASASAMDRESLERLLSELRKEFGIAEMPKPDGG